MATPPDAWYRQVVRALVSAEEDIGRTVYLVLGFVLFGFKYNLDRFLFSSIAGRGWSPLYYFDHSDFFAVRALSTRSGWPVASLVLAALPFIYIGFMLTLARCRSAGIPRGLALLFFVPVVNLVFFGILALLPPVPRQAEAGGRSVLDRLIPPSPLAATLFCGAALVPLALLLAFFSTFLLKSYGAALFVGIPFATGFASTIIVGWHKPISPGRSLLVSLLVLTIFGACMLLFAWEGLICLIMASPILLGLSALGSAVGWLVLLPRHRPSQPNRNLGPALLALAILPLLLGAEAIFPQEPPVLRADSAIEIDAPPDRVWPHVIRFSRLPPPTEWYFRTGIACPMQADISGTGPGAVRYCMFSTGAFVEPIDVWEEPKRLHFFVASQPPPMEEWSPWNDVVPPHLDNFLVSREGEFRLVPLDGGKRTRLEGGTWYTQKMWPMAYWALYSDALIHRIHMRVLKHIKAEAERDTP